MIRFRIIWYEVELDWSSSLSFGAALGARPCRIRTRGYATDEYRSKSWDEFAAPNAPNVDFVITVCDNAVGEVCPIWPGGPMRAHWGVADPAAVEGAGAEAAFAEAYRALESRIEQFASLPLAELDKPTLQRRMNEIGAADA